MMQMLADFHFLRPYAFLALFPLAYLMRKNHPSVGAISHWEKVCDRELLPYLLEKSGSKNLHFAFWLASFMAFVAVFALAAPSWQKLPSPAFRNSSALVIALNLSESMNAQDLKPSRLIRARYKIADLLAQRKDGQTALLVYSGAAFTVTPLTNDIETIHSQLEALTTDIMPTGGNNAATGLEKAVELLKQAGLPQGHILLITDSVETEKTATFVKKLGTYHLSVLGVGTEDGAPIPLADGGFVKDEMGQILVPKLQTEELSELAKIGNGRFQIMSADDSDIQNLVKTFDVPLTQKSGDKTNLFLEQWEDSGYWLVLFIMPWAAWQFRKGAFYIAILFLLPLPKNSYAFEWQNLWHTPDQQAQQAYNKQQYAKAAEKFERSDWKAVAQYKTGDFDNAVTQFQQSNNFYNQGNALAKKGQLQEALNAYEQAIKINPYDEDAKFNKEVIAKELEKQQRQNQENQSQNTQPFQPQQNEKSDNSQQPQDSNNNSDSKLEQKSEHKAGDNPDKKEEPKEEKNQPKSEFEQRNESTVQQKKQQPVQAQQLTTEQQQADEQWLKRIPDDPATLLKRKFKYQYNQQ